MDKQKRCPGFKLSEIHYVGFGKGTIKKFANLYLHNYKNYFSITCGTWLSGPLGDALKQQLAYSRYNFLGAPLH